MLCLSKKTEYALAALAYLAEQSHRVASAREIAEGSSLPPAMLEKILKCLQHHDLLSSTRGANGGYRIAADLNDATLFDLVAMMECPDRPGEECGCLDHAVDPMSRLRFSRNKPSHAPVVALQYKLVQFLKDVKLSDLVLPGRRIDVPAERLGTARSGASQRRYAHADHAH
jgi:Rrf2 family protein